MQISATRHCFYDQEAKVKYNSINNPQSLRVQIIWGWEFNLH